jgi:hypothetical protein
LPLGVLADELEPDFGLRGLKVPALLGGPSLFGQ